MQILIDPIPVDCHAIALRTSDILQGRVTLVGIEGEEHKLVIPVWFDNYVQTGILQGGDIAVGDKGPISASPAFNAAAWEASSGTKRMKISSILAGVPQ